ncbi:MAG: hypothetical protein JXA90_09215, partial [Planctomycetes bacterium]|nr:hypothetical protein [Planctomycetota bacterium]
GESQVHLLEIVEPDLLERILTDQLMVVRDSLRQLLSRQQAVRKEVEDLRDRKSGQDLTREEAVDLSRLRRDQSKIGEGIVRQVSEVDRVLERMEINSVGKIAWKQWVQRIRAEMSALSSGEARAAETQLEDLRRAIQEGPESPARLDAVSEAQRRVERGLRSLVLRLEEFGDRSAILQLLREVRDRQKELMDQTSEEHRRSTAGQSGDE